MHIVHKYIFIDLVECKVNPTTPIMKRKGAYANIEHTSKAIDKDIIYSLCPNGTRELLSFFDVLKKMNFLFIT